MSPAPSADAPRIAVTAGDPCGIGPEVILKALATPRPSPPAHLLVIGDHPVFERAAKRLRRRLPSWRVVSTVEPVATTMGSMTFLDCGHRQAFVPGRSSRVAGEASRTYLDCAIRLWRERRIHALVTAPVTKWAIARVEPGFVGQTEYLAGAMGARDVVMLFVSDRLRLALLTRHLPLRDVARSIDRRLLRRSLRLLARGLRRQFGIPRPKLAVCGLNPHAGEGSSTSEESRLMRPVLRALRHDGLICDGPFAADGFFAGSAHGYDAVVCAYHDQGLIPFKMAARDRGCQVSLGLPIVRTSPDHGSALDIAGSGRAHAGSMRYALRLAVRLAGRC